MLRKKYKICKILKRYKAIYLGCKWTSLKVKIVFKRITLNNISSKDSYCLWDDSFYKPKEYSSIIDFDNIYSKVTKNCKLPEHRGENFIWYKIVNVTRERGKKAKYKKKN